MACLGDFHVCLNQNSHSDCRINYIVRTFVEDVKFEDFKLRLTLVTQSLPKTILWASKLGNNWKKTRAR